MSRRRQELGARGEERAAAHYRATGHEVLSRNWHSRHGEIDLVCADRDTLVFVEVKTRSSLAYGHPAEAVTVRKQARLHLLAGRWMAANPGIRRRSLRFDVVAVLPDSIEVIENAF